MGSGRAIYFDGINDYVDFGDRYHDLNMPFTVSAWLYRDPTATGSAPIFVTNDNFDASGNRYRGFWFYITDFNLFCEFGDGFGGNNPAFRRGKVANIPNVEGKWVHVCVVMMSPFDIDLYLNGVNLGGSTTGESMQPMALSSPGDHAKSGYQISNDGLEYKMKGMIDEIRLWNRALTQSEVRSTMCKKLSGNESGLVGYWNFDETSGTTAIDKSSNGFNGELMNSPTRVYSGAPIGDESTFLYTASWAGTVLTETEHGETVEVSNVL
ncbi:MAG TPA: LamG domain-containing protein, partial [Cyclobacteriaceae bacterium]